MQHRAFTVAFLASFPSMRYPISSPSEPSCCELQSTLSYPVTITNRHRFRSELNMSTSTKDSACPTAIKPEVAQQEQPGQDSKPSLRQRLKHFTFAWFLSTMSTGGLAIAIGDTPHQFHGNHPTIEEKGNDKELTTSPRTILYRPSHFPPQHRSLHPAHPTNPTPLHLSHPPLHPLLHAPPRILLPRFLHPKHKRDNRRRANLRHNLRPRLGLAALPHPRSILALRNRVAARRYRTVLHPDPKQRYPTYPIQSQHLSSWLLGHADGDAGESDSAVSACGSRCRCAGSRGRVSGIWVVC